MKRLAIAWVMVVLVLTTTVGTVLADPCTGGTDPGLCSVAPPDK